MLHDASRFVNMRPVDLFADAAGLDEKTRDRAVRGYKGARVIYTAVSLGRAVATKANLVLAWFDAASALLDAISSYAAYRQSVEVTRQLEAEGAMLRVRLDEMRKQWEIKHAVKKAERQQHSAAIHSQATAHRELLRIDRQHYDGCKEHVQRVGAALVRLRQGSAPGCPRLAALEKTYYKLVHEQMQAAIVLIDS